MAQDRDRKDSQPFYRFIIEYWIEVLAAAFGLVGIVLLAFPVDFLDTLRSFFKRLLGGASRLTAVLHNLTYHVPLNNLLGWGLAALAGVFILWRARVRFLETNLMVANRCPRCDTHLMRVHRRSLDRFICLITQVEWRRYRCENPDCGWTALRRRRHHLFPAGSPEEDLATLGGAH